MKKTARTPRASRIRKTDQLVDALLAVAHRLQARLEESLQGVGLSGPKYWLLQQLSESRQPVVLSQLAAGQKCAASNITQLVDRLEADGLVRRVDDPNDRRSKRAELTALGWERQAAGARQIAEVHSVFLGALSEADRTALERGLGAIGH